MKTGEAEFQAFCDRPDIGVDFGDEFMTVLADLTWRQETTFKGEILGRAVEIWVSDTHQINVCNHVYSGTVLFNGEEISFQIESGDRMGTWVHAWGDVGKYDPPAPTLYTFVPTDDELAVSRPGMFKVYQAWTKEPWFIDKVRGYNYDRHFAPGGKTEDHYRKWAASRGMKIRPVDAKEGRP